VDLLTNKYAFIYEDVHVPFLGLLVVARIVDFSYVIWIEGVSARVGFRLFLTLLLPSRRVVGVVLLIVPPASFSVSLTASILTFV